tara:strand:- start:28934 stop:29302 length:369 start_codon:yes stop_codon:yes gene_type:complete
MFHVVSIVRALPLCAALSAVALAACGPAAHTPGDRTYAASVEPGTRAPQNALEEEVLAVVEQDPSKTATSDNKASIGPSYAAASGRTCRRISYAESELGAALVCEMASGWKFVPEVFVGHAK